MSAPDPAQNPDFDALLRLTAQRAALDSLATFADVLGIGTPATHHALVCDAITEMLVQDTADILVVLMPPGSAKSTYASIALPAWAMARDPRAKVLQASNTAELAERWGRRVRGIVAGDIHRAMFPQTDLDPASQAASRWGTTAGGEYLALGTGASVLGFRADLAIIDDPHRSLEDATSEVTSRKVAEWFDNDLTTRLTPRGKIVLVQQRLAWNDLAGHVMRKYGGTDSPKRLKVIVLKMEAEAGDDDPLGRQPGERLWPEWFTEQQVADAKLDPVKWRTLYQQHPVVGTSEFCSREMIEVVDRVPHFDQLRIVQASDFALGENSTRGDFTAHLVAGVGPDGTLYILDLWRDRQPTLQAVEAQLRLAVAYNPRALLADDDNLVRSMRQFIYDRMQALGRTFWLKFLPTRGKDKRARAAPLEGLLHLRRVKLLKANWNELLLREFTEFPVGPHDDIVDCASLIARHIIEVGRGSEAPVAVDPFAKPAVVEQGGRLYLNRTLDSLFEENESRIGKGYSRV